MNLKKIMACVLSGALVMGSTTIPSKPTMPAVMDSSAEDLELVTISPDSYTVKFGEVNYKYCVEGASIGLLYSLQKKDDPSATLGRRIVSAVSEDESIAVYNEEANEIELKKAGKTNINFEFEVTEGIFTTIVPAVYPVTVYPAAEPAPVTTAPATTSAASNGLINAYIKVIEPASNSKTDPVYAGTSISIDDIKYTVEIRESDGEVTTVLDSIESQTPDIADYDKDKRELVFKQAGKANLNFKFILQDQSKKTMYVKQHFQTILENPDAPVTTVPVTTTLATTTFTTTTTTATTVTAPPISTSIVTAPSVTMWGTDLNGELEYKLSNNVRGKGPYYVPIDEDIVISICVKDIEGGTQIPDGLSFGILCDEDKYVIKNIANPLLDGMPNMGQISKNGKTGMQFTYKNGISEGWEKSRKTGEPLIELTLHTKPLDKMLYASPVDIVDAAFFNENGAKYDYPYSHGFAFILNKAAETTMTTATAAAPTTTTTAAAVSGLCGDANCDGTVNEADRTAIIKYINRAAPLKAEGIGNADVNGDGVVNMGDAVVLSRYLTKDITALPYTEKAELPNLTLDSPYFDSRISAKEVRPGDHVLVDVFCVNETSQPLTAYAFELRTLTNMPVKLVEIRNVKSGLTVVRDASGEKFSCYTDGTPCQFSNKEIMFTAEIEIGETAEAGSHTLGIHVLYGYNENGQQIKYTSNLSGNVEVLDNSAPAATTAATTAKTTRDTTILTKKPVSTTSTTTTTADTTTSAPATTAPATTTTPPASSLYLLGDVNNDTAIDADDASLALAEYALKQTGKDSELSPEAKTAADVTKDGVIDADDASFILGFYSFAQTTTGAGNDIEKWIETQKKN